MIRQPAAHLHPSAQSQCLVELINCGVKVFVTTHSDWILRAVHNLVAVRSAMDPRHLGVFVVKMIWVPLGKMDWSLPIFWSDTELYNDEAFIRHGLDGDDKPRRKDA